MDLARQGLDELLANLVTTKMALKISMQCGDSLLSKRVLVLFFFLWEKAALERRR